MIAFALSSYYSYYCEVAIISMYIQYAASIQTVCTILHRLLYRGVSYTVYEATYWCIVANG